MSGIIDKKGKDSVSKNPYYMISLSGAYDSQSFWKAKDIEATDNILNKPGLDCIYTALIFLEVCIFAVMRRK